MTPEDALQARIDAALRAPADGSPAYAQQIAALKQAIAQGLRTRT